MSSTFGDASGVRVGRVALLTQKEKDARVFNLCALESYSRKLQQLRQPPPRSSYGFGGFQRQFHS